MITTIDDLVIFATPISAALFAAVIACVIIEDVFCVRGVFCIIAAVLTVGLSVASVVLGAKYQELLIALITIAMVQMFSLKWHENGDGSADMVSVQNTTDREVKN